MSTFPFQNPETFWTALGEDMDHRAKLRIHQQMLQCLARGVPVAELYNPVKFRVKRLKEFKFKGASVKNASHPQGGTVSRTRHQV